MKVESTAFGEARDRVKGSDDAWCVRQKDGVCIAALADGMGSARLGGEAARRAVAMITDYLLSRPEGWSVRRALMELSARINRVFFQESQLQHGAPELLCTLSVVVLERGRLFGLNVGDSPVYMARGGRVTELSEAHVRIEPGMEHVLTRALGATAVLEPHLFEVGVEDGDQILLCSDGVSRPLGESGLTRMLARATVARALVAAALEKSGEDPDLADDASALLLRVVERGWGTGEVEQRFEAVGPLQRGDRWDEYVLNRPLQEAARVWEATAPDGRKVVLKFPALEAADDETRRDAFVREAWQASRLDDPGFVRAWTPRTGRLRYYVMEYIEAPTLREVLARRRLSVEECLVLARFLLHCGQRLSGQDLVHGDIKPDNILMLPGGADGAVAAFKLLDLGSAAEVFSVTTRAGTPSYLAPERFHQAPACEASEVFAIGVTLYEALTRTYPYGEIERFQTPRFEVLPRSPARLNPAVPPWLGTVIQRALAPEPERRYRSYSEFLYELDHPASVQPFYRKDAALLERNPLAFYKVLSWVLFGAVLVLAGLLVQR